MLPSQLGEFILDKISYSQHCDVTRDPLLAKAFGSGLNPSIFIPLVQSTKVFISYTHDTDTHRDKVGAFADKLRRDLSNAGVEIITDHNLPPGGPDNDFRRWSEHQADRSAIVIPIFNATYRKCWDGEHPPGVRNGGTSEATVIAARVDAAGAFIPFLRVVIFDAEDQNSIPSRLANLQCFLESRDYLTIVEWIRHFVRSSSPVDALISNPSSAPVVSWPDHCSSFAPDIANCEDEFNFFAETLCSRASHRGTLIRAASDHGKTKLVGQFYQYGREVIGDHACSLVDFKDNGTTDYLLDTIAYDLGVNISGFGERNPSRLREGLRKVNKPVLFVFDSFELATDAARQFVETYFLADMSKNSAMRIVLAGQPANFPNPAKASWQHYAKRFDLHPIPDPEPWIRWSAQRFPRLSSCMIRPIVAATKGIPGPTASMLETLGGYTSEQLLAMGIK